MVLILCWQAQWAMTQFLFQTDLGMRHLGETRLDIHEPGVAKLSVIGIKIIRGYGPYSHPNVLAGAMVFGVTVLMILRLLMLNNVKKKTGNFSIIISAVGLILMMGVALSFSRSAFAGAILALVVGIYFMRLISGRRIVNDRLKKIARVLIFGLIILMSGITLLRFNDSEDVAWPERLMGYQWAFEIIKTKAGLIGIGPGKYRDVLKLHLNSNGIHYEPWQIDYVHSVPLLTVAEWGVLAVIFMVGFTGWAVMKLKWLAMFLIPLIPLLLLDHYLVTQPAPLFLLGMLLMILVQSRRIVPMAAR